MNWIWNLRRQLEGFADPPGFEGMLPKAVAPVGEFRKYLMKNSKYYLILKSAQLLILPGKKIHEFRGN